MKPRAWLKAIVLPLLPLSIAIWLKRWEAMIRCYLLSLYYEDDEYWVLRQMSFSNPFIALDVGSLLSKTAEIRQMRP